MMSHLTVEQCATRYPHLVQAMKWVGVLSTGEATWAIWNHRAGRPFSGEAVDHFGGPRAVLQAAWRSRHIVAQQTQDQRRARDRAARRPQD